MASDLDLDLDLDLDWGERCDVYMHEAFGVGLRMEWEWSYAADETARLWVSRHRQMGWNGWVVSMLD